MAGDTSTLRPTHPWFAAVVLAYAAFWSIYDVAPSRAGTVLTVDFGSGYTNGNLVGQNSWAQTGSTTTNPILVTSGSAIVGNTGQDVNKAFPAAVTPLTSGSSLLTRIDFVPTAVQANGDYFFHVSDGGSSNFYQRFFARLSGGNAQFGVSTSSTSAAYPASFGVSTFALNQPLTAVMKWNFISGTGNDTIDLYMNPSDPSNPSGSPYTTATGWGSNEPTTLGGVNLRQGSSTAAPTVRVSDFEVAVVPEPMTTGFVGMAMAAIGLTWRRSRAAWLPRGS